MEDISQKTSIIVVRCGQQELDNAAIVSVIPQTDVPRPGERVISPCKFPTRPVRRTLTIYN